MSTETSSADDEITEEQLAKIRSLAERDTPASKWARIVLKNYEEESS